MLSSLESSTERPASRQSRERLFHEPFLLFLFTFSFFFSAEQRDEMTFVIRLEGKEMIHEALWSAGRIIKGVIDYEESYAIFA